MEGLRLITLLITLTLASLFAALAMDATGWWVVTGCLVVVSAGVTLGQTLEHGARVSGVEVTEEKQNDG